MSNAPRDENRTAGLIAKSDADNSAVVVEADPTTKRLKVNATITGSGGDTQYTTGDATAALPIGTMPVYDNAGTIAKVGINSGLPIQYDNTGGDFPVNIQNAVLDVQQLGAGSNFNVAATLEPETTKVIGTVNIATSQVDEQTDILETIASAIQAIASTRGIAADLRVTILSGTVTTVTTLSNITSIGGINAVGLVPSNQNTVAVLSNINNVV